MGFSVWMYRLSRPKSKFLPLSRHFCITSWFNDDVTCITSIGREDAEAMMKLENNFDQSVTALYTTGADWSAALCA